MSIFMQPIFTQTIGATGATNAVVFNNIPQTFTDLILIVSARSVSSNSYDSLGMTLNSTYGNYTRETLNGTAIATSANRASYRDAALAPTAAYAAGLFGNVHITIPNYTSNNYKQAICQGVVEANTSAGTLTSVSMLYQTNQPVTTIQLDSATTGTAWAQYSSFSLYGVLSQQPVRYVKGSGGVVSYGTDGYIYHQFIATGTSTFTPNQSITADVLVVAGGGSGGNGYGAGGGGGGVQLFSSQSLTSGLPYSITVGTGGSGAATSNTPGNSGTNSQFGSLTPSIGGGGGGGSSAAKSGGSGGGGAGGGGYASYTLGSGTSGQGYNGGAGTSTGGGGGGGASGLGGVTNGSNQGGAGGPGIFYFGAYWGAGGSGNGTGGSQTPGFNGSPVQTAGLPNTGNGGGGDSGSASGGSGIVIVRYQG